jgi:hypothetical protein
LLLVTSPNDLLSLDDDAGQEPTKLEFSESVRLCVALRDRPLPGFETDTAESAAAEPS